MASPAYYEGPSTHGTLETDKYRQPLKQGALRGPYTSQLKRLILLLRSVEARIDTLL